MLGSYLWICQGTRPHSNSISQLINKNSESYLTSLCKLAYRLCSVLAPNAVVITEEL